MFDDAVTAFGAIDILMNNAGVDASGTDVADLATEVWDKAIRTNVYFAFFAADASSSCAAPPAVGARSSTSSRSTRRFPNAGGADCDCAKPWRRRTEWAARQPIPGCLRRVLTMCLRQRVVGVPRSERRGMMD